jgi:hypothetical protein
VPCEVRHTIGVHQERSLVGRADWTFLVSSDSERQVGWSGDTRWSEDTTQISQAAGDEADGLRYGEIGGCGGSGAAASRDAGAQAASVSPFREGRAAGVLGTEGEVVRAFLIGLAKPLRRALRCRQAGRRGKAGLMKWVRCSPISPGPRADPLFLSTAQAAFRGTRVIRIVLASAPSSRAVADATPDCARRTASATLSVGQTPTRCCTVLQAARVDLYMNRVLAGVTWFPMTTVDIRPHIPLARPPRHNVRCARRRKLWYNSLCSCMSMLK